MATPAAGSVVLLPFPFSDLTQSKRRPAVVLADAGRGDWILCQVTSNPYGDPQAVMLDANDFRRGGLRVTSYARPAKLFTASQNLIASEVGWLHEASRRRIVAAIIRVLKWVPKQRGQR